MQNREFLRAVRGVRQADSNSLFSFHNRQADYLRIGTSTLIHSPGSFNLAFVKTVEVMLWRCAHLRSLCTEQPDRHAQ